MYGHAPSVNIQFLGPQEGIACDECSVWHHRSCLSMCSEDYKALERPSVVWKCCVCDSLNCDSFTFRSYELDTHNSFSPLSFIADSTLDSVYSNVFSPLHTSSPTKSTNKSPRQNSTISNPRKTSSCSTPSCSNAYPDIPSKRNLRILNVNCRSVKENNTEFKLALNYIKPDIICGTESWLKGIKPGKQPSASAIKNSEIFPSNYTVYRNDRGSRGGGVYVAVQNNLTSVECVDFITGCKVE